MRFDRITNAVLSAASTQLIWLASLPLITRLYSVSAVGAFGVFVAYMGFLATIIGMRSDISVLSADRHDAGVIRQASALIGAGLSVLSVLMVLAIGLIKPMPFQSAILNCLVVAGAFAFCLYTLDGAILVKEDKLVAMRNTAIFRGGLQLLLQLGAFSHGAIGLIMGRVAADFAGALLRYRCSTERVAGSFLSLSRIYDPAIPAVLRKYKHVYLYSLPQSLMNSFSQYLPVLLLPMYVSQEWLGYYTVAFMLAVAPIALLGMPLRQLFIRDFSDCTSDKAKRSALRFTLFLLLLSAVAYAVFVLIGRPVLLFVLGPGWGGVYEYLSLLLMWSLVGLANTPVIALMLAFNRNRAHLVFETVSLLLRIVSLVVGVTFFQDVHIIAPFVYAGMALNLAIIFWVWRERFDERTI